MSETVGRSDFLVIGGGIAGASAAAGLAQAGRTVVLLEREAQPGYHTTGRSAALFTETYGPPAIRALTTASRAFLTEPPDGFSDHPLLGPRGALLVGRADQAASIEAAFAEGADRVDGLVRLDGAGARALVPVLREGYAAAAVHEPGAMDMDVAALHQGFLRQLRSAGGLVLTDAEVSVVDRSGGDWQVRLCDGRTVVAAVLVDAAGAWAEEVAALAGAAPIGLVPKRRTILTFDPVAAGVPITADAIADWPMLVDVDEDFYMKPESGRLMASPADETPSPPCDAQPDEYDVALAAHRVEQATTLEIRRIAHSWAGLRSFVTDKTPVVGYDDGVPGFFWLAGQGGYGIQTAPALGRVAAALALEREVPQDVRALGVTAADLAPGRLERRAAVLEVEAAGA